MRAFIDDDDRKQVKYGDMDTASFSRYGHHLMDWMVDYLTNAADTYPTLSRVTPGDIRRSLPELAPDEPESMETIFSDIYRLILPGITHSNTGNFMGHFGLSSSAPNVLAEMLDATFNVTRMLWSSSPAATELEQVTLKWLREMLGLPEPMFGMLHHNSAHVYALIAAREAIPHLNIARNGLAGRTDIPPLRLYASEEAYSSVDKAAIVTGLGLRGLRKIGTDGMLRMDVDALEHAIEEDLHAGYLPFAVFATVGTSSTSIDPVVRIASLCERYGLWLHVDATSADAAVLLPEKRWILDGCERAHSLSINPHKWFFASSDCSAFYTRYPQILKAALSLDPDNLERSAGVDDDALDLMDYDYALPHRFPALKLWIVMRYFGREGLVARIAEHCRLAQWLAEQVDTSPVFERMAEEPLSVVCLRAHPVWVHDEFELDALNESIMLRVNAGGHYFLSHTRLRGRYVLRVEIGNIRTMEEQVHAIWNELQSALQVELGLFQRRKLNNTSGPGILRMLNLPYRSQ
jgi:aromatic-L-amino-acid decarboxylase